MTRILLGVAGGLLALALILQIIPKPTGAEVKRDVPLEDVLPRSLAGWFVEDRPIADTEIMQNAVGEILNFDEAIFRAYKRGGIEFSVYLAYWEPGKMSHRLVAGHTPDVCWVAAGWKCTALEFGRTKTFAGQDLAPAQWRIFEGSNTIQHVLYWHFSGTELIHYDRAGPPPISAVFRDLFNKGLNQRLEQYFIRISSNVPFEEIWNDPGFQAVIDSLLPLGISAEQTELRVPGDSA